MLAFAVALSRAASRTLLTVDYATSDGSAQAGVDLHAATIEVVVLDDSHDGGEETLTLSNASSGWLADGEATGTIENADLMPALLAHMGRATAGQVVEHIEERMVAPRRRGFRARPAGRELRPGSERDFALGFLSQFAQPHGFAWSGRGSDGRRGDVAPMAMGSHAVGPGVGAGMRGSTARPAG